MSSCRPTIATPSGDLLEWGAHERQPVRKHGKKNYDDDLNGKFGKLWTLEPFDLEDEDAPF